MPKLDDVKVTVVLEFDISTTVSNAAMLGNVELILDPVLTHRGSATGSVNVRAIKVKSVTVEGDRG